MGDILHCVGSIQMLHSAAEHAKIGQREQIDVLKRLVVWADAEQAS